jgi:hypothetical protein
MAVQVIVEPRVVASPTSDVYGPTLEMARGQLESNGWA